MSATVDAFLSELESAEHTESERVEVMMQSASRQALAVAARGAAVRDRRAGVGRRR